MIDTNIILDVLLKRKPQYEEAAAIFNMIADQSIIGYTTASCITDIFYLVAKHRDNNTARDAIKIILSSFEIIAVDVDDCWNAVNAILPDFEDSLVMVCADKMSLDYIVTNDKKFLKIFTVPIISSRDFLSL